MMKPAWTPGRDLCNPLAGAEHDILGVVPLRFLGASEACVTNGHVDGIPVACSQMATSNCIPSPDDGDRVVVWETGRSYW